MKKFLISLFKFASFFLLFFILINGLFLLVIITTDWDFKKRHESLRFNDPDYELLAMGASSAFDGFDTELLTVEGIKSYNLALGGNSIHTCLIQLTEYLNKCVEKPTYVLLGLNSYAEDFEKDFIHPTVEVTMEEHRFNLNDIPLIKFKWLGFEFFKKIVSRTHRNAKLVQGQLRFQKSIQDPSSYAEVILDVRKFDSSNWLGELARLCHENGIVLFVFEMPGYRATQNCSEIGPYNLHFKNGYSALLFNCNNREFGSKFDSRTDWVGNSHLNESGARKYTEALLQMGIFAEMPAN